MPPAAKIESAAATSIGCLSPTMRRRLAFMVSMSTATGARISAEETVEREAREGGGVEDAEEAAGEATARRGPAAPPRLAGVGTVSSLWVSGGGAMG